MSLHGTHVRLPYGIDQNTKKPLLFQEALALNFIELLNRVGEGEVIRDFTQLVWPYIFIQSEPNKHVMIDDVGITKFNQKLTSAPRTAQAGHVLRDPNLDHRGKLDLVKKVISFKHRIELDQEGINSPDVEEFYLKEINGLVGPNLLEGFQKLLPHIAEFQMSEMPGLESLFTFDDALEFAKQYVELLRETKGNVHRWKTLQSIIQEPVEKWLIDYRVKKKDIEDLYKSKIQKAHELDESMVNSRIDSAKFSADQWLLHEQKNVIQKIGGLFVSIDLITDELRRKNKFFTNTDTLKTLRVDEVVARAFKHIAYIRESFQNLDGSLSEISVKMNTIRADLEQTNVSADQKVEGVSQEMQDKIKEQAVNLASLEKEKAMKLGEIEKEIDTLSQIWQETQKIITEKIEICEKDLETLRKWQIDDDATDLSKPVIRMFLPIGFGVIEDDDEDERIEIILPSFIEKGPTRLPISPSIKQFEQGISNILDKNIKIRSNFEFTGQKMNLKNNERLMKAFHEGIGLLVDKQFISGDQKLKYVKAMEKI